MLGAVLLVMDTAAAAKWVVVVVLLLVRWALLRQGLRWRQLRVMCCAQEVVGLRGGGKEQRTSRWRLMQGRLAWSVSTAATPCSGVSECAQRVSEAEIRLQIVTQ